MHSAFSWAILLMAFIIIGEHKSSQRRQCHFGNAKLSVSSAKQYSRLLFLDACICCRLCRFPVRKKVNPTAFMKCDATCPTAINPFLLYLVLAREASKSVPLLLQRPTDRDKWPHESENHKVEVFCFKFSLNRFLYS